MKTSLNRFLSLFFAVMICSTLMAQSAEEYYNKGKEYFNNKNYTEAVKWYRKAAEQGLADAQFSLGDCYLEGEGVTQNMTEAVKWFRKAAEQGLADAQFALGACYQSGTGVTQNIAEAKKWHQKAADQGNEYAIDALKKLK